MAATLSSVKCLTRTPYEFQGAARNWPERSTLSLSGFPIVCKSQRNSRYEKSKKHARQGHATIPQQAAVVPSNSLPHNAVQAKKHSGMEARKERSSSPTEHAGETPVDSPPASDSPVVAASVAAVDEVQPARSGWESAAGVERAEEEQPKSHWDDFWSPRLFWVFRALGTVVD